MRLIDLSGQQFGRLTVVRRAPNGRRAQWLCICECGGESVVAGCDLRSGHTTSCGCHRRAVLSQLRHGHGRRRGTGKRSPTYNSWRSMRYRTSVPTSKDFPLYGARGIAVCERWRKFENFLADMGERPDGLTLDRIDNDGNYEPGNCRWATPKEQRANRRDRKVEAA